MRHRLAILTCALVLLAPAGALAQDGNPFDGSLPPMIHSVSRPTSSWEAVSLDSGVATGVGCAGGRLPSNGLPSWASAPAGASRTTARVRIVRR